MFSLTKQQENWTVCFENNISLLFKEFYIQHALLKSMSNEFI